MNLWPSITTSSYSRYHTSCSRYHTPTPLPCPSAFNRVQKLQCSVLEHEAFSKTDRKILAMVGFRTAITFYNRSRGQFCSGRRDKLSIFAGFSRDDASKFASERASGLVVIFFFVKRVCHYSRGCTEDHYLLYNACAMLRFF
jgi:hypothetical protein